MKEEEVRSPAKQTRKEKGLGGHVGRIHHRSFSNLLRLFTTTLRIFPTLICLKFNHKLLYNVMIL